MNITINNHIFYKNNLFNFVLFIIWLQSLKGSLCLIHIIRRIVVFSGLQFEEHSIHLKLFIVCYSLKKGSKCLIHFHSTYRCIFLVLRFEEHCIHLKLYIETNESVKTVLRVFSIC